MTAVTLSEYLAESQKWGRPHRLNARPQPAVDRFTGTIRLPPEKQW
jgi:hypothetical protein